MHIRVDPRRIIAEIELFKILILDGKNGGKLLLEQTGIAALDAFAGRRALISGVAAFFAHRPVRQPVGRQTQTAQQARTLLLQTQVAFPQRRDRLFRVASLLERRAEHLNGGRRKLAVDGADTRLPCIDVPAARLQLVLMRLAVALQLSARRRKQFPIISHSLPPPSFSV